MSEGLKLLDHCVIKQEFDPLEWCVPIFPCSSKFGLPCFPCDRANNFQIFQSNEHFDQLGMKAFDVQEETTLKERILCCPSNRAFKLHFEDFYGSMNIEAIKNRKVPFCNTQQILVSNQNKYIGMIEQKQTCIQMKNNLYEELCIYERNDQIMFKITSQLKQCGHCCIMPCSSCKEVVYDIYNCQNSFRDGFIKHSTINSYNELCSKSDQYYVQFPKKISENQKILIATAAIFLDYLNYENL